LKDRDNELERLHEIII